MIFVASGPSCSFYVSFMYILAELLPESNQNLGGQTIETIPFQKHSKLLKDRDIYLTCYVDFMTYRHSANCACDQSF